MAHDNYHHTYEAIKELLGNRKFRLFGTPTNETEFNASFRKITGTDSEGTAIESDDPSDFGITWSQVETAIANSKIAELRVERNKIIAETDWEIVMHKEKGTNVPTALKTYRQALRDITDTYTSLDDVVWPEKP